ncbi:hypothetical protein CC80DRAFT_413860 [Byssothecium circinans]|uniref:Uncharacterized protein n=1 Tax=Byssothecium circinans TaxID=147558 RepID=A0A6A5TZA6_9PLEO|nr:hypothetical protein CC80DRAFT_413860 [Byssothecium circinans]
MRRAPLHKDERKVSDKRLRKSGLLPLQVESGDSEELYYHEAQTSSLSWGPDEWFWTELFLVDTYFGSEDNLLTYLAGSTHGNGFDPPLGGVGTMETPCFDPRDYWLMKLDRRVLQVTEEYTALIETFNNRMEEYGRKIQRKFEDDRKRTHTQTLSNVIETIQIFVDCISGVIIAWETFQKTQISFFTIHAREKLEYPRRIDNIIRHMAELERLKRLLITKRERFKFKLNSYVAFPLLFTAAIFSMEFVHSKYPWVLFFAVLLSTSLVNYIIASHRSPWRVCLDCKDWIVDNSARWRERILRRP